MSGSGGGGGGGPRRLEIDSTRSCADYFETVQLSSPNPEVVKDLRVEAVLQVVLREEGATPTLVAETDDGGIAGSLIPPGMTRLISCIVNEGYSYVAIVERIDGAAITVQIRPH